MDADFYGHIFKASSPCIFFSANADVCLMEVLMRVCVTCFSSEKEVHGQFRYTCVYK